MRSSAWLLVAIVGTTACVPDAGRSVRAGDTYQILLDAEDARPAAGDALDLLLEATAAEDPFERRLAVRALGRLERPSLAEPIAGRLADGNAGVRAAAAEALAQSVHGGDGSPVLDRLLARVETEEDPAVRGQLARSLGRLSLEAPDRRLVEEALVELGGDGLNVPEETLVGVALGFESFVWRSDGEGLSRPAADLLTQLLRRGSDRAVPPQGDDASRIRALAATALGPPRRLSLDLLEAALDDPEPEVRRVVPAYLDAVSPARREALLRRALADPSPRVAIAAVQHLAGLARTAPRCDQLIAAAGPERPAPLRWVALEALGRGCPNLSAQRSALVSAASALGDGGAWQPAARAVLSLTTVDTDAARRLLPRFVDHDSPFVRTWAARAAGALREAEVLAGLADDDAANVRAAALPGLFALQGHDIDDRLLAQLSSDDPQLLMVASRLLEEAPNRALTSLSLLSAFERISGEQRETWRDARVALLARVAELGDASLAGRLTPFVSDYDALVAEQAAEIVTLWTGAAAVAEPRPLPRASVPTLAELRALEDATLTLHMESGDSLVIELFAEQAPTNVARLVRLAEEGYYDGLTFHRWVPNFVIQGGSPGANEYQGDGPYTRDEVGGVAHWRGTVGLSTRGRDTGDSQIFVNLVHNPRLNHDYTVMGRVVVGYDVLDGILEGAVIYRAVVNRGS